MKAAKILRLIESLAVKHLKTEVLDLSYFSFSLQERRSSPGVYLGMLFSMVSRISINTHLSGLKAYRGGCV